MLLVSCSTSLGVRIGAGGYACTSEGADCVPGPTPPRQTAGRLARQTHHHSGGQSICTRGQQFPRTVRSRDGANGLRGWEVAGSHVPRVSCLLVTVSSVPADTVVLAVKDNSRASREAKPRHVPRMFYERHTAPNNIFTEICSSNAVSFK